jgi:hypothetical protein
MNWRLSATASDLTDTGLVVERAEGEDGKQKPDAKLVACARTAASTLAERLGGSKDHHVEITGHETRGRGFTPAHVTITVSRLDPKRYLTAGQGRHPGGDPRPAWRRDRVRAASAGSVR